VMGAKGGGTGGTVTGKTFRQNSKKKIISTKGKDRIADEGSGWSAAVKRKQNKFPTNRGGRKA